MINEEIRQNLRIVYKKLSGILELYDQTNGYKIVPERKSQSDVDEYWNRELWNVHKLILKQFASEETLLLKMLNILDETENFVKNAEMPGVVMRWREINPDIEYFDVAFDIVEESFELKSYIERGIGSDLLSVQPNAARREKRQVYFQEKYKLCEIEGKAYSEGCIFQDELTRTLLLVFVSDFAYFLIP